ncbi:MAG: hypothetical protein C7B44_01570 [Sulfobacillus thermosulfidooxidans]|nr:MAG: hypothetical protein C7B44_01570 [Sulfobacillus thermosulfidooxidans]
MYASAILPINPREIQGLPKFSFGFERGKIGKNGKLKNGQEGIGINRRKSLENCWHDSSTC